MPGPETETRGGAPHCAHLCSLLLFDLGSLSLWFWCLETRVWGGRSGARPLPPLWGANCCFAFHRERERVLAFFIIKLDTVRSNFSVMARG